MVTLQTFARSAHPHASPVCAARDLPLYRAYLADRRHTVSVAFQHLIAAFGVPRRLRFVGRAPRSQRSVQVRCPDPAHRDVSWAEDHVTLTPIARIEDLLTGADWTVLAGQCAVCDAVLYANSVDTAGATGDPLGTIHMGIPAAEGE